MEGAPNAVFVSSTKSILVATKALALLGEGAVLLGVDGILAYLGEAIPIFGVDGGLARKAGLDSGEDGRLVCAVVGKVPRDWEDDRLPHSEGSCVEGVDFPEL